MVKKSDEHKTCAETSRVKKTITSQNSKDRSLRYPPDSPPQRIHGPHVGTKGSPPPLRVLPATPQSKAPHAARPVGGGGILGLMLMVKSSVLLGQAGLRRVTVPGPGLCLFIRRAFVLRRLFGGCWLFTLSSRLRHFRQAHTPSMCRSVRNKKA